MAEQTASTIRRSETIAQGRRLPLAGSSHPDEASQRHNRTDDKKAHSPIGGRCRHQIRGSCSTAKYPYEFTDVLGVLPQDRSNDPNSDAPKNQPN